MTTHIVLLRAVNVGGTGKIAMAGIRDCLTKAGFADVRTLLQSGNVVFRSEEKRTDVVEARVEAELLKVFSLQTQAMARSTSDWKKLIEGNPFPDAAKNDPSHLVALLTKRPVKSADADALTAAVKAIGGNEKIGFHRGQLYATYPDGIGDSRLISAVIERATKCPVTARNWNTVLKLAEISAD
jgi:uncharacterized protein (DUF1697 family)